MDNIPARRKRGIFRGIHENRTEGTLTLKLKAYQLERNAAVEEGSQIIQTGDGDHQVSFAPGKRGETPQALAELAEFFREEYDIVTVDLGISTDPNIIIEMMDRLVPIKSFTKQYSTLRTRGSLGT